MADSTAVKSGLDSLIAENWSPTVIDNLSDILPLLSAMITKLGQNKKSIEGLGIPDSGMVLTGVKSAKVRQKEILSSLVYQPIIHTDLAPEGDGKVMGMYDNLPSRSDWENNGPERRFKRPAVKWVEVADPCKVANKVLRHTKRAAAGERELGWKSVGDLLRVESSDTLTRHLTRWSQLIWGNYSGTASGVSTTGAPSNEDDDVWDAPYSVKNACKEDNTYCGVDRSQSTGSYFRGNFITGPTSPVFRDMIRYANYNSDVALAKKNKRLDAIFVGATLFQYALAEADSKTGGQIIRAGEPAPGFSQSGWKQDIVKIDNTFVVFDPGCPDGDAFGVNFKGWTLGIHPDANFKQSTPEDQSKIEGGDDAHTWNIRTQLLLICEDPSGQCYWDDVQ